jgi:hypothetical protein
MQTNDSHSTIQRVHAALQSELGKRQVVREQDDSDAPIAYIHPGAEHPLLIFQQNTAMGLILRIDAPVAAKADWSIAGLPELLLTEQGDWLYGRNERWGEGVIIEHCVPADTPTDRLASIVVGLADTALHLHHDLARMGALTTPEEAA